MRTCLLQWLELEPLLRVKRPRTSHPSRHLSTSPRSRSLKMDNPDDKSMKEKRHERSRAKHQENNEKTGGDKAYASTLLLPRTKFPVWNEPPVTRKQYHERTTQELYEWQAKNLEEPAFVLHDGPPYANGNLHAGHALNKILKDVILRYNILQGRKVSYVPGWDCHGLPVENKTLEKLKADPNTLPPATLRAAAKQTAEEAISTQRKEMDQFGLVGNWKHEGTYRTMDPAFESRQLRIFQKMVKGGLIYRHFRPVHWSPSSQTALAEAELQYEMHTSTSAYVGFSVVEESIPEALKSVIGQKKLKLLIWTTTPWTLPTNMGISVHPDFEYSLVSRNGHDTELLIVATSRLTSLSKLLGEYTVSGSIKGSALQGVVYWPLFHGGDIPDFTRPILTGHEVLDDAGTGLVHMAPSHGHEDYQSFLSRGLLQNNPLINIVDAHGRYTSAVQDVWGKAVAQRLVGLEVLFKGNKEVLALLEEDKSDGTKLLGIEKYRHRYPYDWRTKKPMIIRATAQWFANLDEIKERSLQSLDTVEFYPAASKRRLQAFIQERSQWCISRQRTWGVPIPFLHIAESGEAILDEASLDHIIALLEEKGTSYWWEGPIEEFIAPSLAAKYPANILTKGTDTMDVWFDSGTSWSSMQGGVADVYLEGSDQHRGWFQSSLLTAIAVSRETAVPQAPFKKLITHGFVLDDKGRKMSKSLGNVISPLTVINGGSNSKSEPAYGVDVLRLWAVSTQYSGDVAIGTVALKQAAETLRKLRVTARFLLGSLQDAVSDNRIRPTNLSLLDKYVLNELWNLERDAKQAYDTFAFHEVVASLSRFVNATLSSLYFDVSKDVLYADPSSSPNRLAILYVLNSTLQTMTPIIAPLVPYLAEEIQASLEGASGLSVFQCGWESVDQTWRDEGSQKDMEALLQVRKAVIDLLEKARTEKKIRSSLEADIQLILPDGAETSPLATLLYHEEAYLSRLFIVSNVTLENDQAKVFDQEWAFSELLQIPDTEEYMRICVRPAARFKCPRCWSYTKEEEQHVCGRCKDALSDKLDPIVVEKA
ncbi:isoleucine-tRNA ligase [Serendipita sp. 407]|nr:isoleucine-tRNA ligase [Serendipita sp. 407]